MDVLKQGEHNPEEGRLFAYVYTADGDLFDTQRKAYDMFAGSNYFQCLKGIMLKCTMITLPLHLFHENRGIYSMLRNMYHDKRG